MKAGQLRHRLTFYQPQETIDSNGDIEKDFLEIGTIWGSIKSMAGNKPAGGDRFIDRQQKEVESFMGRVRKNIPFTFDSTYGVTVTGPGTPPEGLAFFVDSFLDVDLRGIEQVFRLKLVDPKEFDTTISGVFDQLGQPVFDQLGQPVFDQTGVA